MAVATSARDRRRLGMAMVVSAVLLTLFAIAVSERHTVTVAA
jgi:hypothetical protein